MRKKGGFMFTKNNSMKAVYSSDIELFLEKLGLLDDFKADKITCRYCKEIISEKNLYAIVPHEDKIEFCCSKGACVLLLTEDAEK